jgi:hypothetical protein
MSSFAKKVPTCHFNSPINRGKDSAFVEGAVQTKVDVNKSRDQVYEEFTGAIRMDVQNGPGCT